MRPTAIEDRFAPHARPRIVATRLLLSLATLALAVLGAGCGSSGPTLEAPAQLLSPYRTASSEVLWAVAPLRNESGTTLIDPLEMSDQVVQAVEQIRGVRALPLNRTLEAMRALEMEEVSTPGQALQLAQTLGADGILAGSITAWDPYNPPTIGLALAVFSRSERMEASRTTDAIDPRTLESRATDGGGYRTEGYDERPWSVASALLDGKNHQVLLDLQSYAEGRHDPESALGWRRYLSSTELFAEFAAWHVLSLLLDEEWQRLARERSERPETNRT